jgi:alcohol dehydrogenase class IV
MFQSFPFKTPFIHFGLGTVSLLGKEVKKLGGQKVMVITGPSVKKAGMLDRVMASLKDSDIAADVNIQGRDTPEPSTDIAEETAQAILDGGFDLVVGLGGGSILDVAKMASALTKNPGKVRDYFGKEQVKKKGLPTVMIPTTSGTGAEVTKHAIFLDAENQVKKAVASTPLLPDVAIVDPEMTYTCPRSVTAAAGIDAWIHAAEPYVSKNANVITDALSLEAVRIITRWLGPAVADENNLEARYWMAMGSLISGLVLNNAGTSLVHAMAYPIGGEFHTPHGISLTVLLVSCFEGIISAQAEKFARLAEAMGENIDGLSVREAAEVCMDSVLYLLQSSGLPACLPDAGITDESKVPRWAKEAHAERRLLGRCAKNLTEEDIAEIYKRALLQR